MRILLSTRELGYRGTPRTLANYVRVLCGDNEILVWGWESGGLVEKELRAQGVNVLLGKLCEGEALAFRPDIFNLHRYGAFDPYETKLLSSFKSIGSKCIETNVFGRYDESVNGIVDISLQVSLWDLWQWNCWSRNAVNKPIGIYCPNIVDTEVFKPKQSSQICQQRKKWHVGANDLVIGRIGNTDWRLFAPVLVAALKKYPNLHCVSVNDHSQIPLELINNPRVHIQDRMDSRESLAIFYSSCDFCVSMSSIGESFGLVIAESMACGTPVIALSRPLHCNAPVEVVCHDKGGLIIHSPRYLLDAIDCFISDPNFLSACACHARKLIQSRYSLEAVSKIIMPIFSISRDQTKLCAGTLISSIRKDKILPIKGLGEPNLIERLLLPVIYSPKGYALRCRVKTMIKLFCKVWRRAA